MARRDYDEDEYEDEKPRSKKAGARSRDDDDDRADPPQRSSRRRDEDDEPEEEAPRSRRRRDEDEDEDERPARRPSRSRVDEDEEEEKPKRRSSSRDEEDDGEPVSRKRRPARDDDEDEDEAPRRTRGRSNREEADEDEDDAPRRKSTVGRKKAAAPAAGWGAGDKVRDTSANYAKSYNPEPGAKTDIIKFIPDDEGEVAPYSSFKRHWLKLQAGNRPFTCIEPYDDKGCPLCDMGDRPVAVYAFNIGILQREDEPVLRSWEVGTQLYEQFKNFNNDKALGPLSRMYYAVFKPTGKNARVSISPAKERDLEEDHDVEPLDKRDIADLVKSRYTADIVQIPTRKELRDLADSLED